MNALIRRIAVCVTMCAIVVLAFAAAADAAAVSNIRLRHVGDFTEISIPVPARLLCDHFTQPADPERPFRIVLNLCGVTHALPQKNFSQLPACLVRTIRTSQYAVEPEPMVRVVLDLAAPATYTVRTDDDALTIAISDPQADGSLSWEAVSSPGPVAAGSAPTLAKTETSPAPAPVTSVPASTAAPRKERSVKPDVEETHASTPTQSSEPAPAVAAQSNDDKASEKYLIPLADHAQAQRTTQTDKGTQTAPSLIDEAKVKSATTAVIGETTLTAALSGPAVAAPDVVALVPPVPEPSPTETSPPTISAPEPLTAESDSRSFILPEHPLVLAPEYLDEVAPAKPTGAIAETQPGGDQSATLAAPVTSQAQATPSGESQVWASVEGPATEPVASDLAGPGNATPGTESLIDRLKVKFFSNRPAPRPYTTTEVPISGEDGETIDPMVQGPPTPSGSVNREALLERIRLASQESVTPPTEPSGLASGPLRPEVHYNDLGRRDPFEPLLKGLRSGFVSDDLPSVEALRMVGVLRDEQGSMALLEDMEGHSYIMRAGDAVANGRVLAVGDQRVVFSVDEYGFNRTVVLQLSPRGGDPSKSLGATTPTTEPVPQTAPE